MPPYKCKCGVWTTYGFLCTSCRFDFLYTKETKEDEELSDKETSLEDLEENQDKDED